MIKTNTVINTFVAAACSAMLWHSQAVASTSTELGDYPEKPVHLVVPFPAGGTVDGVARHLAPELEKIIGQSVVVENRGGAGGSVGAGYAARAKPDGYTLLLVLDTHALNPLVYDDLPYDSDKDFKPISLIAQAPMIAVANLDLPVSSIPELVDYAKERPGELNYASVGAGSASHLTGELFNHLADVSLEHIPYRGGAPAMVDLVGGQVETMWGTVPYVQSMVKSGKIKALGQTGTERSATFPDVLTMSEQGLPNLDAKGWVGFLAPSGVSDAVVEYWHDVLIQATKKGKVAERLGSEGFEMVLSTPDEFRDFVGSEQEKWSRLIKERNIKLQ